jgi:tight adherence protein B
MSNTILVFFAVFAMTVAIISLVSDFFTKDHRRISNRIEEDFRSKQREKVKNSPLFIESKKGVLIVDDIDEFTFPRESLESRLEVLILQSGTKANIIQLKMQSVILGLTLGSVSLMIFRNPIPTVAFAVIGFAAPLIRLSVLRKMRQDKLRSQLPDAFDLMARVVRAGQTINQSIMAVADEFPKPISEELSLCFEQQNLGLDPETAYRDLARRTGVLEIRIFVTALIVQQQTGGNLAELIDKLSNLIRQRYKIMGQIKTLTAEGRLQAMILTGLPIMLFGTLMVLNPEYEIQLIYHPVLIYTTVILMTIGGLWIKSIINFDF